MKFDQVKNPQLYQNPTTDKAYLQEMIINFAESYTLDFASLLKQSGFNIYSD